MRSRNELVASTPYADYVKPDPVQAVEKCISLRSVFVGQRRYSLLLSS